MRLGVLDVGSNTVHLLVVDAHPGARPLPAYSHKVALGLAELVDESGAVSGAGEERLVGVVSEAMELAEDQGVEDTVAFATSAIREATNGDDVIARVRGKTGADLHVLSGEDEARLTFLAVRRWFGWSAGRLLVLDIGGGSLEIASGVDEDPDAAVSVPLGSGRLTRDWFTADPPPSDEVKALRKHVRTEVARVVGSVVRYGRPELAVGTSKTFRSLARVTGAAPYSEGLYARRALPHKALEERLPKLAAMSTAERAKQPGVSESRAHQLVAGALVADAAMSLFKLPEVAICPWALREGVILRRLDWLADVFEGETQPR